jgi:hypothetical protein
LFNKPIYQFAREAGVHIYSGLLMGEGRGSHPQKILAIAIYDLGD